MVLAHLLQPKAEQVTTRSSAGWTGGGGFNMPTSAGVNVGPQNNYTLSAYFACIRNVSEDIGKVPVIISERIDKGRGKERAVGHPLFDLLKNSPNPHMTAIAFHETLMGWAMGWGNAYAEIERDGSGTPVAMWPIHPSRSQLKKVNGEIVLDVYGTEHGIVRIPYNDIIHIRGFGDDPLVGITMAKVMAESVGLTIAAERFGAGFFGNGATPSLVITHPGSLKDEAITKLRNAWIARYGSKGERNGVAVLDEGVKVEPFSIAPEDAQFLETRKFQIDEIARWFRVPPHKIGSMEHATFSNIEHQSLEYVTDTLGAWFVRIAQEYERKLLTKEERKTHSIDHNSGVLLRGDTKTRSEYLAKAVQGGFMTPNEAREIEDRKPLPTVGADSLWLQGAMVPVDKLAAGQGQDNAKVVKEDKKEDGTDEADKETTNNKENKDK